MNQKIDCLFADFFALHVAICTSVSLTSLADLTEFSRKACAVVFGSLVINNLDSAITESMLRSAFGNLTSVMLGVSVTSNPALFSLDFLTSLRDTPVCCVISAYVLGV